MNLDPQPFDRRPVLERCKTPYTLSEQAPFGSSRDLKGLTKVYVDALPYPTRDEQFEQLLATIAENHRNEILATISEAKSGLVIVSRPEDAEIILSFCTNALLARPRCSFSIGEAPSDWSAAEVYVEWPLGLRVVMLYSNECTIYTRQLGRAFAEEFLKTYQMANVE